MLDPAIRRTGFVACAITLIGVLLAHVGVLADLSTIEWMMMSVLALAILILGGINVQRQTVQNLFWKGASAWTLATVVLAWHLPEPGSPLDQSIAVAISFSLGLLMLSVFRTSPVWYAGTAIVAASIIGTISSSVGYGLLAGIAILLTWVALNYGVQLFLDHHMELGKFWALSGRSKFRTALRSLLLMLPVFALCAMGWKVHQTLQTQFLEIPYAETTTWSDGTPLIHRECPNHDPVNSVQLEVDLLCTLDKQEVEKINELNILIENMAATGSDVTKASPQMVAEQVKKFDPPRIDGNQACRGFTYSKKFVKLSFTSPCKGLVGYINDAMTRTHARIAGQINATAQIAADRIEHGIHTNLDAFKGEVQTEVQASFAATRQFVRATFIGFEFLGALSFAMLCISLVATFQMIQGRVLFNQPTDGAPSMTFQLRAGKAKAITGVTGHSLTLSEDVNGSETWFAKLNLARRGPGTAQHIVIPQPLRCVFDRIFSGTYILTKITVDGRSDGPVISVAGDTKLVRVSVNPGQTLCFRISDVVAFTSGVKFLSRYKTHVGTHLLRLGTFYSVVEGSGFLVLRTEGEQIANTSPGDSTPTSNLLVWDEAHAFALDQHLGFFGIWLNPPSLVSKSARGTAVADEGATERFPLLSRVWGLLRYLFLPF